MCLAPPAASGKIDLTYPRERAYRAWYLKENAGRPLIDLYKELAARFPHGLADQETLPEEAAGLVQRATARRNDLTFVAAGA